MFGIITAMPSEATFIKSFIQDKSIQIKNKVQYTTGLLLGKPVVLVNTGIGLINAAAITARLIHDYAPREIVLSGVAGGIHPDLAIGDVVVANKAFNADFGCLTKHGIGFEFMDLHTNPQSGERMPLIFESALNSKRWALLTAASRAYKLISGTVADSDNLPNPHAQIEQLRVSGVDVVAMESAAIAQVCWLFDTKWMVVRAVSNKAQEAIRLEDIALAEKNAAEVAMQLIGDSE